jgi:hypothetical protein
MYMIQYCIFVMTVINLRSHNNRDILGDSKLLEEYHIDLRCTSPIDFVTDV